MHNSRRPLRCRKSESAVAATKLCDGLLLRLRALELLNNTIGVEERLPESFIGHSTFATFHKFVFVRLTSKMSHGMLGRGSCLKTIWILLLQFDQRYVSTRRDRAGRCLAPC